MNEKYEVSSIFSKLHKMINTKFEEKIRRVRSDNDRNYFNQFLTPFFQKEDESSCVETPQQNRVEEQRYHLLEVTCSMLFKQMCRKFIRSEVVLTATHLINQLPSRVLGYKSSIPKLSKFFPDLISIKYVSPKVFGWSVCSYT